tara:strand:+ start:872 stop:1024 length:153 start_codon:yes stop_codon:yes gene_type:complete
VAAEEAALVVVQPLQQAGITDTGKMEPQILVVEVGQPTKIPPAEQAAQAS